MSLRNGDILLIDEEGKLKENSINAEANVHFVESFGSVDCIVGNAMLIKKGANTKWK